MHRFILIAGIQIAWCASALAQNAPAPPPARPAAPASAPANAAPPAAAAAAGPTLADYARRDPAVAAVLQLPRQTASAKLRAVILLIDLGHPEVAAAILPELLQEKLDAKQQAALVEEFGSGEFMKLIRLDPAPSGARGPGPLNGARIFAQACLSAADAQTHDPARIAAIISQLNAPAEADRYAARVDLRSTDGPGIAAAFTALATANNEDARANILAALADMRPAIDQPLLAVLADAHGQLRRDAAELAGHTRLAAATTLLSVIAVSGDKPAADAARTSLARLGLPMPTQREVERLLRQKLASIKQEPMPTIGDGTRGIWWTWDDNAKKLSSAEYPVPELRKLAAARLSRALAEVGNLSAPADARLVVITGLEEAALLGAQPSPELQKLITSLSPAEVNQALGEAMADDDVAASVRLIGELAQRNDLSVLSTGNGRPSPLASALENPVAQVRFAALSAIMQLHPTHSFPGSSKVANALWYFAAAGGDPAAIVAAPDLVQASEWAGQLRGHGFDATPVRTGRDALLAATDPATSSRLGLIVLDSDIGDPLVGEVVYQLRVSERTAGTPILICSSAPRLAASERIAAANSRVIAVPRPHGEGALAELADRAMALTATLAPPKAERTLQAKQALVWLAKLLAEGSPYDELQRDATLIHRTLYVPELSVPSIQVLSALRSAESQPALVDYASSQTFPIEARRAAATAFAANVKRFGLQLTRAQALTQYDRYNASETADADTQQVLGQILDVIERKSGSQEPANRSQ
jgi:hypothetical protein